MVLFERLKSATNHSLKTLDWLPNKNSAIAELCFQLDDVYRTLHQYLANQSAKHLVVPAIFQVRWDEYIKNYQKKVGEIAEPLKKKYEQELIDIINNAAEAKGQSFDDFIEKHFPHTMGASFNPIEDNAAELLDNLFTTIYDIVNNEEFPEVFTDKHMGALNHFEKVIGMNFHDINRRWEKAPNLFISEKVKKNKDKLVEMYHEAVKSYVFGQNISATAMCRALLEHILINYYKIPKDDLVKVVSLAENQFKKLKTLNLHKLRKDGNDVLHEYESKSKIEDAAVIGYLLTIRGLVGLIPE